MAAAALPPHVAAPPRAPRFPRNLARLLLNNLSLVPEQAYHDDVTIAPGPPRMAFVCGAEAVERVLKPKPGEFPKGWLQNQAFEGLFGNAMISSEGEDWRWQRSIAAPLFRHEQILNYAPIMQESAAATIEAWRADTSGGWRAINKDMMHATFGVISKTMLVGGAPDVIAAVEKGHAEYFRQINWWILYRALRLPRWTPRPGARTMRAQETRLRAAVTRLVEERRANPTGGRDLLDLLLAAEDPETHRTMPTDRLVYNIIAFLVAGYDTTALALSWALFLLARYPEWQARIRAEVATVAGDAPIGAAHLPRLVVTERVLNEALRHYPTAPVIIRDVLEDVEIGGTLVRKGTILVIPMYVIHRHRAFWRDPDSFDPDRFDPANHPRPSRYQFLPFGGGPRICIGAAFAIVEAKIMLASFMRAARFDMKPGVDPTPTGQLFLTANGDIPMRVTMR